MVVETRDAFSGRIKSEADKVTEKIRLPFANPQNGPIMIEGAAPGDALAVHIEEMPPPYPPSVGIDRNKICHPAPERDHIMIVSGFRSAGTTIANPILSRRNREVEDDH